MDTTPIDGDNFPCQCHLSQYAYTDDPCPECEVRLAESNANPDEEPELLEEPGAEDYSYFSTMTQDDWDADNDWLASAGWGEM